MKKNDIYEKFNNEILTAFKNIKTQEIIEGDLIAGLSFGFWTSIIGKPFVNILENKDLYIKVFKELKLEYKEIGTTEYNKKVNKIRGDLNNIRSNRNRVFHHEKLKDYDKTEKLIWEIISQMSKVSHDYFLENFKKSI
ncbi:hypothetical protein [Fluviispira sanaruensis]|uniref:Uncharacterized protein n=1 Tax=Fluviispira sanaruensis TaxID=2493639 RepID=A0A4P2VHN0_FLUSA|nr:hypothetical protein [Fluviispira sanaruensis]BBH52241.1 hypothetical protein JCM31447_06810 [Fluviispira sanaruensis]